MAHPSIDTPHRLFFALVPPIVQARQIAHAAPWFRTEGAPVSAERLHLTLFMLDDRADLPLPLIETLRQAGETLSAAPIDMVLDRAVGSASSIALRPHRRIAALDALHRQIERHCRALGIEERANYAFSPHMTLGYRSGRPFSLAVPPVAWTARDIVLVHSHLGRRRHDRLGCWPLDGSDPQLDLFASVA